MPCSPITFPPPVGPSGPAIPGFGVPYSIPVPPIGLPPGVPEDLIDIFNELLMLIPTGILQPALNPNFGKDIFDGILKLLDQFMPYLMLYKMLLPILNLIICIIEVLCALTNPIALAIALDRLFTQCLPPFLNLFPLFALILMIIALLLMLLQLIEYILLKIIDLILALLRNIAALVIAFQYSNATGVLAIANKLANLLCVFQNLLVLLAFFDIILQVIKDILQLIFAIPPCEGGSNSNCCGSLTCPLIVQNPYTNTTGNLQYLSEVGTQTTIILNPGPPATYLTVDAREESWQIYDPDQTLYQQFWNIVNAYDVIADGYNPPPVYFPTTQTFTATTAPAQAAYTVNLRFLYDPTQWGRTGNPQYLRFNNCIVLMVPTQTLEGYDTTSATATTILNGVLYIAGGAGTLDDGTTVIDGYAPDGITPLTPPTQATLNNFLHLPATYSSNPFPLTSAGLVAMSDVTYTFTPNLPVLMGANLITLGCQPSTMLNRAFVNNVVFSNINAQTTALTNLVNSPGFPSPAAAQQCLTTALNTLRGNMTVSGVAEFQANANTCLNTLQNNTQNALTSVIGIGFSPCSSNFTLAPTPQFTTQAITISVNLNENSGLPIVNNVPTTVGASLATQIKGYPTFGSLSQFTYDGYHTFTADLTSPLPGTGSLMISFQNQILCTNTLPANGVAPNHALQSLDYEFIYAPFNANLPPTGEGDTIGIQPRRNLGEVE